MRTLKSAALAIAAIGVALAIGTVPAVAQAASTTHSDGGMATNSIGSCTLFLQSRGVHVGDNAIRACAHGASGTWYGPALCVSILVGNGVNGADSTEACRRAAN
jgi:hypothetical protein